MSVMLLVSSCMWMPMKMSTHEKRLWNHQNKVRGYYYRIHPFHQKRIIRGKTYIPYFRPGKY